MIAPLRTPESPSEEIDTLARARRYVAEMLLSGSAAGERRVPAIAAWKAWMFVGWITLVLGCYFGRMFW